MREEQRNVPILKAGVRSCVCFFRVLWRLLHWLVLRAPAAAQSEPRSLQPLRGQKILLKGDSIARGYGFGNYTDPSPLRTIPGIGSLCCARISVIRPLSKGSRISGRACDPTACPKTVDTLAAELNDNIKQGNVATGDWLIYEDAGEVDQGIHPAPASGKRTFISSTGSRCGTWSMPLRTWSTDLTLCS